MLEGVLLLERAVDQKSFSYTSPSVDGNEFGPVAMVSGKEFVLFAFSSDYFHVLSYKLP